MIFNYVDPYQPNILNRHSFLDPSLSVNPVSPPTGFYQASPSSIDYLVRSSNQTPELTDEPQSLAAIAVGQDPLDRFLNSKKESLTGMAKGILGQIYERLTIRDTNFYEIDQRISRANGILETLSIFYLGANMVVDKRKAILERELIAFEQERRFEAVSCWRDISRLKLQLGEIGQLLDNHTSRERLIEG
jgi:hypothetical protein